MDRPNIVLITVDSMRWDRFGRSGYAKPVTPNMDAMMNRAVSCDWTYSLCPSTAGALPSLMTSTRPLSFGGFDKGILGRPPSLAKVLGGAGYHVAQLSTAHWANSLFGYSDGSAEEELLISMRVLSGMPTVMLRDTLSPQAGGGRANAHSAAEAVQFLHRYYRLLLQYCDNRSREPADVRRRDNSEYACQAYHWDALRRIVERHIQELELDPDDYLEAATEYYVKTRRWILGRDLRGTRARTGAITESACWRLGALIRPFAPRWAGRLQHPYKWYMGADVLVDRILELGDSLRGRGKPFFIWTHLFDAHIPFTSGTGRRWVRDTANWLRRVGHDPRIDPTSLIGLRPDTPGAWTAWRALYDAALCFIDAQLGRLRENLDRRGLGNTLLAIVADHGEELGEHGDSSHRFRLYEHNARVPALLHHPDFVSEQVGGFATLMDIAPTVAEIAGAQVPDTWEGAALSSLKRRPRDHIVLETFFGSPCDFSDRPIYMAARAGRHKLMFNERVDPRDPLSHAGVRLFDVVDDPYEQSDIARQYPQVVERLMEHIRARLHELRIPTIREAAVRTLSPNDPAHGDSAASA